MIDPVTLREYIQAKAQLDLREPVIKRRVVQVAEVLDNHRAFCCEEYWPNTDYGETVGFDDSGAVEQEGITSFEIKDGMVSIAVEEGSDWGQLIILPVDSMVHFSFPISYLMDDKYFEKQLDDLKKYEENQGK